MIGLAPPGRIRPWRLNAAVTALRAAFPGAKVHIHHYDFRAGFADFIVHEAMTITEVTTVREMLAMRPRRLRVAAEVLEACKDESDVAKLIADAVPRMDRGVTVGLGLVATVPAKRDRLGRPINRAQQRVRQDRPAGYPPFGEWALHAKPAEPEEIRPAVTLTAELGPSRLPSRAAPRARPARLCRRAPAAAPRGRDSMTTALAALLALEAFIQEHLYCSELDSNVEDDRVWMTCSCGAVLVRVVAFG